MLMANKGTTTRVASTFWKLPSLPILLLLICFGTLIVQNALYSFTLTSEDLNGMLKSFGVPAVDCCQLRGSNTTTTSNEVATASTNPTTNHRRLVTVFSSGCSNYQDWQSQVLVHSWYKQNIPGELVRLMSCKNESYEIPKIQQHHQSRYKVVRTPDFNAQYQDDYSPRNRPGAMAYWLNGQAKDIPPTGHSDIVLAVDPDMIFLSNSLWSVVDPENPDSLWNMVGPGKGAATLFGIGYDWIDENMPKWRKFWCPKNSHLKQCDDNNHPIFPTDGSFYNPSYGHPQVMTAEDARSHAELWLNVTNDMRTVHRDWLTEMYSNVITSHRMKIDMQVLEMQVSAPQQVAEQAAWESLSWYEGAPHKTGTKESPYLLVAHYCQNYRLGDFKFDKRVIGDSVDMRNGCGDGNATKPSFLLPPVPGHTRDMIETLKFNHSKLHGVTTTDDMKTILSSKYEFTQDWNTELARNGWFIEKVYGTVQEAMGSYYEEFCLK